MATTKSSPKDASLQSSLKNLSIATSKHKAGGKSPAVAESWEESEESTSEDGDGGRLSTPKTSPRRPKTSEYPGPPPPTPSSPQFNTPHSFNSPMSSSGLEAVNRGQARYEIDERLGDHHSRPEKTTSAASRMIAAGLGVKAPPKTEEQKQYDKAMRDKERKAREADKEAKRRAEESKVKAKQAIWDD